MSPGFANTRRCRRDEGMLGIGGEGDGQVMV